MIFDTSNVASDRIAKSFLAKTKRKLAADCRHLHKTWQDPTELMWNETG